MSKIATHLWFDTQAKEAATLYASLFNDSRILRSSVLSDTPSGNVDIVNIELLGQQFTLLAAGPLFRFNPSISFQVAVQTKEEVDALWEKLSKGSTVLMELGKYPFSERFGWLSDRYGLSWQIMYEKEKISKPKITPFIMFVGDVAGKAEEAMNFWISVFFARGGEVRENGSKILNIERYGKGERPEKDGDVKHAVFTLNGKEFGAMDSRQPHQFSFNEAISFMVYCRNQEEIDYYWGRLSAVPESEQCGWLKDKYGVSWQIVPEAMDEMMEKGTKEQVARVTQAFLQMKKFDLAELQKAYDGSLSQ